MFIFRSQKGARAKMFGKHRSRPFLRLRRYIWPCNTKFQTNKDQPLSTLPQKVDPFTPPPPTPQLYILLQSLSVYAYWPLRFCVFSENFWNSRIVYLSTTACESAWICVVPSDLSPSCAKAIYKIWSAVVTYKNEICVLFFFCLVFRVLAPKNLVVLNVVIQQTGRKCYSIPPRVQVFS
jgi:hypothetical protein